MNNIEVKFNIGLEYLVSNKDVKYLLSSFDCEDIATPPLFYTGYTDNDRVHSLSTDYFTMSLYVGWHGSINPLHNLAYRLCNVIQSIPLIKFSEGCKVFSYNKDIQRIMKEFDVRGIHPENPVYYISTSDNDNREILETEYFTLSCNVGTQDHVKNLNLLAYKVMCIMTAKMLGDDSYRVGWMNDICIQFNDELPHLANDRRISEIVQNFDINQTVKANVLYSGHLSKLGIYHLQTNYFSLWCEVKHLPDTVKAINSLNVLANKIIKMITVQSYELKYKGVTLQLSCKQDSIEGITGLFKRCLNLQIKYPTAKVFIDLCDTWQIRLSKCQARYNFLALGEEKQSNLANFMAMLDSTL